MNRTRPRVTFAVVAAENPAAGWVVVANPKRFSRIAADAAGLGKTVATLIGVQRANARLYTDMKDLIFGVIRASTSAIDAKDPYTSGHSERVARVAVRLAEELGMSSNHRGDLYLMGLLHDIGKIGIDDSVLKKRGPLTPEEYKKIQAHVNIGVAILADLKKLSHLLPGIEHHHESYDGKGYPKGLAGENIPYEARILAVADAFDAMSSTRPDRPRLSPAQISEIFTKGAAVQWDPHVVDALFACRGRSRENNPKGARGEPRSSRGRHARPKLTEAKTPRRDFEHWDHPIEVLFKSRASTYSASSARRQGRQAFSG